MIISQLPLYYMTASWQVILLFPDSFVHIVIRLPQSNLTIVCQCQFSMGSYHFLFFGFLQHQTIIIIRLNLRICHILVYMSVRT